MTVCGPSGQDTGSKRHIVLVLLLVLVLVLSEAVLVLDGCSMAA
jgi:hypothetical protein